MTLPEPISVPLREDDGGVIRVGTTRVTLHSVIADYQRGGSPEAIVHHYSALTLADVYVVLGYYLQHQAAVDAYIEEQRRLSQAARVDFPCHHPAMTAQVVGGSRLGNR